jgi:hypothetical protein
MSTAMLGQCFSSLGAFHQTFATAMLQIAKKEVMFAQVSQERPGNQTI